MLWFCFVLCSLQQAAQRDAAPLRLEQTSATTTHDELCSRRQSRKARFTSLFLPPSLLNTPAKHKSFAILFFTRDLYIRVVQVCTPLGIQFHKSSSSSSSLHITRLINYQHQYQISKSTWTDASHSEQIYPGSLFPSTIHLPSHPVITPPKSLDFHQENDRNHMSRNSLSGSLHHPNLISSSLSGSLFDHIPSPIWDKTTFFAMYSLSVFIRVSLWSHPIS